MLRKILLPAEIWGHHAVHIDPITQLQGYGHGEPAGTQPGVGTFPERQERINISSKSELESELYSNRNLS